MNYYNEWDSFAAEWLRELIKDGLIPEGETAMDIGTMIYHADEDGGTGNVVYNSVFFSSSNEERIKMLDDWIFSLQFMKGHVQRRQGQDDEEWQQVCERVFDTAVVAGSFKHVEK